MIIFENGTFMTNSEYPNEDWTGERKPAVFNDDGEIVSDGETFIPNTGKAKYVIPDGLEFAAKVLAYFPNYRIVEDGSGGITDVVKVEGVEPIPQLTIEDLAAAIAELAEVVANG